MAKKYHRRSDGLLETTRTDRRTGKRVHFYGRSERELNEKIMAFQGAGGRDRRFADIAEEWKKDHFDTLALNTLKSYRPAYQRAVAHFGKLYIRQIHPQDIKRFIVEFSQENGGRARKTVTTQLLIIRMICGYSVEMGYIEYSPCDKVRIPKNLSKKYREPATPEDEKRVKDSADIWLLPYLILYTGLRKGEALALSEEDFDFENQSIHVGKSVYFEGNRPRIKTPKTAAGIRTVPLLEPLREKLPKEWSGYLFSIDGGKTPLSETQYQRLWREYSERTGVRATAHQLRHSFATMLFEWELSTKDAQDILGHSTVAMTQDIYMHITASHRKKVADFLNEKIRNDNKD